MNTNRLLLLLLLVSCLLACKKSDDVVPPPPEKPVWKLDSSAFLKDKILLNGVARDEFFGAISPSALLKYDTSGRLLPSPSLTAHQALNYKPALNAQFNLLSAPGQNYIVFWPITADVVQGNRGANITDLDTAFVPGAEVHNSRNHQTSVAAFNNANQALVAINEREPLPNGSFSSTLVFALVNFNFLRNPYQRVEVQTGQKITLPEGQRKFDQVFAFKDRFLVAAEYGTYPQYHGLIIYRDGSIKKLNLDRQSKFFEYAGNVYALRRDYKGDQLLRSVDDGESWQPFSDFPDFGLGPEFTTVDGKLVAYYKSQLFHVDLEARTIKELDNAGLQYNEITSVNLFHSKVYVTTLSGLYYLPAKDFFRYK